MELVVKGHVIPRDAHAPDGRTEAFQLMIGTQMNDEPDGVTVLITVVRKGGPLQEVELQLTPEQAEEIATSLTRYAQPVAPFR